MKLYKSNSTRTIILAVFATLTLVGSAVFIFDVEPGLMAGLLLVCVLGLGVIVLVALLFTGLKLLLCRWFER